MPYNRNWNYFSGTKDVSLDTSLVVVMIASMVLLFIVVWTSNTDREADWNVKQEVQKKLLPLCQEEASRFGKTCRSVTVDLR